MRKRDGDSEAGTSSLKETESWFQRHIETKDVGCWQLSLSSVVVASQLLSRCISASSHLLHTGSSSHTGSTHTGISDDAYSLLPLAAEASDNLLQAVTATSLQTVDGMERPRHTVKRLVTSLSSSLDHLLQVRWPMALFLPVGSVVQLCHSCWWHCFYQFLSVFNFAIAIESAVPIVEGMVHRSL